MITSFVYNGLSPFTPQLHTFTLTHLQGESQYEAYMFIIK